MNASTLPPAHLSPCMRIFIESLIAEVDEPAAKSWSSAAKQPPITPFVELQKAKVGARKRNEQPESGYSRASMLVA